MSSTDSSVRCGVGGAGAAAPGGEEGRGVLGVRGVLGCVLERRWRVGVWGLGVRGG